MAKGIWFDTHKRMGDGTPRTVCAKTQEEVAEFEKKGWVPVKGQPGKNDLPTSAGKKVEGTSTSGSIPKSPEQTLLSGTVAKVVGRISEVKTEAELQSLLAVEKTSKKPRKGIVDTLLAAIKESIDSEGGGNE